MSIIWLFIINPETYLHTFCFCTFNSLQKRSEFCKQFTYFAWLLHEVELLELCCGVVKYKTWCFRGRLFKGVLRAAKNKHVKKIALVIVLESATNKNQLCLPSSTQDDSVRAKTSRTRRRGRPTSAVPWTPCRTSASCRSTAGREATTPTGCTGCCPACTRTGAGEVRLTTSNRETDIQPDS